ncbi:MAG: Fe2+-dependent dioxygenase [Chromatiales bacterium]|nr:Fe2+-dependent dioxygenase [Chromatiales bacterium]
MLLEIHGVLNAQELARVHELLDGAAFVNGVLSAGKAARRVKQNLELDRDSAVLNDLNQIVMNRLLQRGEYQKAALPFRVATPFYARYVPGMTYGDHVDDPVMGPVGGQYRCDVATTVFLNGPDDYEGGELVVRTPYGEHRVKLAAGDAVVYPASSLHQVAPVSRGQRIVAVTWAQSMVRDPARRELLFELDLARESLLDKQPDDADTARINHVYNNLVRMWSEV